MGLLCTSYGSTSSLASPTHQPGMKNIQQGKLFPYKIDELEYLFIQFKKGKIELTKVSFFVTPH
jgi:hypothetical protein